MQLFTVEKADVLKPGEILLGHELDAFDRDPNGIDVVVASVDFWFGLTDKVMVGFEHAYSVSVSSPGLHPVPPPPLDIVVLDGEYPNGPYRSMSWTMPYLENRSKLGEGARFDDFISGDYIFKVKAKMSEQEGWMPATTFKLQLSIPYTHSKRELVKGSGADELDLGFHTAATWHYERFGLSANLGMTLPSSMNPGDVILMADTGRWHPNSIKRPFFLHAGVGVEYKIVSWLSVIGEFSRGDFFGGHTPIQNESGASDMLAGIQISYKGFSLAAGVRQHLNPAPHGVDLPTGPLAGGIDLSRMSLDERNRVLDSLGVEGYRPGANVVIKGWPAAAVLPAGATLIPQTHKSATTGNTGSYIRMTYRFGT
jgi:hypothetical protein